MNRPQPPAPNLLIDPTTVQPFDRGNGVVTVPYVGKWNCETNRVTTGQTAIRRRHRTAAAQPQRRGVRTHPRGTGDGPRSATRPSTSSQARPPGCPRRAPPFPQPRRLLDAHLLGLRRPRRHPHHHRDWRDVRAPVRERPWRAGQPMTITTVNPATGRDIATYDASHRRRARSPARPEPHDATRSWGRAPIDQRVVVVRRLAAYCATDALGLEELVTEEMGKPLAEARGELAKSALTCDYYAESAHAILDDHPVEVGAGQRLGLLRAHRRGPGCHAVELPGLAGHAFRDPGHHRRQRRASSSTHPTSPGAHWRCKRCARRPGCPRASSPRWWSRSLVCPQSPSGSSPTTASPRSRSPAATEPARQSARRPAARRRSRCSSSAAPMPSSCWRTPTSRPRPRPR